ncbi:hypothetical protein THIOM_004705 [Candidatus Thiomargarita nelsonii]|uniref:Alginate export domain-containing protein n=1 Tax=Candidatus Thiomargarita nelsonii TaxID=1003181 RepID=A0A176RV98_9GAMM|nr:hypothetical protein THIOM_004705 [Candidatus Thiomargarita nelsonii]
MTSAWSGHLKYQIVNRDYDDIEHLLDFRLMTENRWGAWDAQMHYEVLSLYSDTPQRLPNDKLRLFNLTDEWGNSDKLEAVHRLDRLFVGYSGEQLVLRLGRQAVTWGNGLIFQPLDIFSPFSPTEIDKDYKTGDDMLYGQWLFENGNDLQMILLPRRHPDTEQVESDQSSLAFKYHGIDQADFDLLLARHYDENVFGIGLSKDIAEAVWRLDISLTWLKEGNKALSLVSNIDYSWVWFDKNFYGYLEYFRNGLGETQRAKYLSPDPALQSRLQRGEIYTLGRDYLGSGLQIELTPLFNLYSNWIGNLHDSSGIFQIRGIYDWMENVQLIVWLDLAYGDKGTEFGEAVDSAYFRLIYYF